MIRLSFLAGGARRRSPKGKTSKIHCVLQRRASPKLDVETIRYSDTRDQRLVLSEILAPSPLIYVCHRRLVLSQFLAPSPLSYVSDRRLVLSEILAPSPWNW